MQISVSEPRKFLRVNRRNFRETRRNFRETRRNFRETRRNFRRNFHRNFRGNFRGNFRELVGILGYCPNLYPIRALTLTNTREPISTICNLPNPSEVHLVPCLKSSILYCFYFLFIFSNDN